MYQEILYEIVIFDHIWRGVGGGIWTFMAGYFCGRSGLPQLGVVLVSFLIIYHIILGGAFMPSCIPPTTSHFTTTALTPTPTAYTTTLRLQHDAYFCNIHALHDSMHGLGRRHAHDAHTHTYTHARTHARTHTHTQMQRWQTNKHARQAHTRSFDHHHMKCFQ